jgi:osmotically-inducible protein OsmY
MTFSKQLTAVFTAFILATALGCASGPKDRSTGVYIDDATVSSRVKTAIFKEPNLKVAQINVETFGGQVQLSGFVSSQEEKTRAAEVAKSVQGVKSVKNDIRLR